MRFFLGSMCEACDTCNSNTQMVPSVSFSIVGCWLMSSCPRFWTPGTEWLSCVFLASHCFIVFPDVSCFTCFKVCLSSSQCQLYGACLPSCPFTAVFLVLRTWPRSELNLSRQWVSKWMNEWISFICSAWLVRHGAQVCDILLVRRESPSFIFEDTLNLQAPQGIV